MTASQPKPSDLGIRTLSAIVMVAVSGAALWLGGWAWTLFVAVVAVVLLWEWRGLVRGFKAPGLGRFAWNAGGFVYIAVAVCTLLVLRNGVDGIQMVLLVVGAVIATDVGAYFAGRIIGGPKIAPRVSPSKTWAGLLGGMVGSALITGGSMAFVAWVMSGFDNRGNDLAGALLSEEVLLAVLAGALIAIVAQAGDFFESWMKRRAGVKDSSNLIPGHGGVLDRLDGLLAVLFVIGLWGIVMVGATLSNGGSLLPSPA